MAGRRLSPDEAALWRRVVESVRPITKPRPKIQPAPPSPNVAPAPPKPAPKVKARPVPAAAPLAKPAPVAAKVASNNTLDGGWDRRLSRGLVAPDSSIDLHGHSLASAHAMLDQGLARAIAHQDRLLLLVTGKPPRAESERPHARGAIRAAIGDWIAGSRHADRIAAVRAAHPRHGGAGALYIVLRRQRLVS